MACNFTSRVPVVFTGQLFLAMALTSPVWAQDCTPENITIASQVEMNDFQADHGPCDTVTGELSVSGNDIVDLSPLSALTSVGGYLRISFNEVLTNLDGLSALTSVGGFAISTNTALTNLDGLSALTRVDGYFSIGDNTALIDLDGLSALTSVAGQLSIGNNAALTNIDGLSSLTSVFRVVILNNDTLTNLDALSALTSMGGGVHIDHNAALTNLDGLSALISVGEGVYVYRNDALTNLDGLSALISMGGRLSIRHNAVLTNLDGLSALISVGEDVRIQNNPSLADCTGATELLDFVDDGAPGPGPGLAGIPDVADDVDLSGNLPGCNSVMEILAEAPLMKINAGLNDAWFNFDTNGQGFLITVFPEIKQMFMAWFTYDTERPPEEVTAILGEPGHRWLTAQGEYVDNIAELTLYVSTGGMFDSEEPMPGTEPYGEILLEFSTCNSGVVTYDIPSVFLMGSIAIERIALDNVSLCYVLEQQALSANAVSE